MKVLHAFQNLEEANLAISFLESEGVQATIWDQNVSSLYPLFNPSIGMVRIAVDEADLPIAQQTLKAYFSMLDGDS